MGFLMNLNKILLASEKYFEKHLGPEIKNKNSILNKDFYAFKFFWGRTFFQRFKDELNYQHFQKTFEMFNHSYGTSNWKFFSFNSSVFANEMDIVYKELLKLGVMEIRAKHVISSLNYKYHYFEKNLSKSIIDSIIANGLEKTQTNLIKNIYGVGEKVSSFYLRDFAQVFDDRLSNVFSDNDWDKYFHLNPIDVHVKKISEQLGIIKSYESNLDLINTKIINFCKENGISPIKFNQGAYMLSKFGL